MTDCDDLETEPMPISACPRCGAKQDDPDRFGVQKCDGCGYCRHPSETNVNGCWVCDLCGREAAR